MYQQGHSLQEVGETVGIVGERVRQLFKSMGLQTRSLSNTAALKGELYRGRAGEIVDAFRRYKDPAIAASQLEIPKAWAIKILREQLSTREYREITRKPPKHKKKYSEEELIAFLREAGAAAGRHSHQW